MQGRDCRQFLSGRERESECLEKNADVPLVLLLEFQLKKTASDRVRFPKKQETSDWSLALLFCLSVIIFMEILQYGIGKIKYSANISRPMPGAGTCRPLRGAGLSRLPPVEDASRHRLRRTAPPAAANTDRIRACRRWRRFILTVRSKWAGVHMVCCAATHHSLPAEPCIYRLFGRPRWRRGICNCMEFQEKNRNVGRIDFLMPVYPGGKWAERAVT